MRVAVAGGGDVGQTVARTLTAAGHQVLVIERHWPRYRPRLVPEADWLFADACEVAALQSAYIGSADAAIAATGDDKANLVFAVLAKKEFGVPRVLARINDPNNQWLFTADWGVDLAISTPGALVFAAEQAMTR